MTHARSYASFAGSIAASLLVTAASVAQDSEPPLLQIRRAEEPTHTSYQLAHGAFVNHGSETFKNDPSIKAVEEATLAMTGVLLADALGPAWGMEYLPEGMRGPGGTTASLTIHAPRRLPADTEPPMKEAIVTSRELARLVQAAEGLPQGAEREQAQQRAKEAADRVARILSDLRVETTILPLRQATGSDVADALKLALPYATFGSVGGNQIVASGTKRELAAARDLVTALDERAIRALVEEKARIDRMAEDASNPAWRLTATPLNIDFPGGPLSEYLKALSKSAGAESWFVEDPRLGNAIIPAVRLTGVTADSAVKMLDKMSLHVDIEGRPWSVGMSVRRIDPDDRASSTPPIYRLSANMPPAKGGSAGAVQNVEVFDVALSQYKGVEGGEETVKKAQDALLAAIESGMSLMETGESFKVKLHPPSGMLFVSGTPDEVHLVRRIVEQWLSTN